MKFPNGQNLPQYCSVKENMVVGVGKAGGSRQRAEGNKFVKIFLLNSKF
jgi:hypothetical protein